MGNHNAGTLELIQGFGNLLLRQVVQSAGRLVKHEQLGLGPGLLGGGEQIFKEVAVFGHGNAAHVGPADDGGVHVDGIGGVGREHDVAGIQHGEAQMGEPLLGTDGGNGLRFGIEMHVVAAGVEIADGLAQIRNAAGNGIAVIHGLAGRFAQFVHDEFGRRQIGIAHGQVNNVDVLLAELLLDVSHNGEGVGRETVYPRKFGHTVLTVRKKPGRAVRFPGSAGMTLPGCLDAV